MPFVLDNSAFFCNKHNGSAPKAIENDGKRFPAISLAGVPLSTHLFRHLHHLDLMKN
jgi:hypothetical protein